MLDAYVGQKSTKNMLLKHLESAQSNKSMPPHILFDWPSGMGKTSLAKLFAEEFGAPFLSLDMSTIGGKKELFQAIYDFTGGVILFDEIQSLTGRTSETLLPFISNGEIYSQGKLIRRIPNLTVIAATTDVDKVIPAIVSRFPLKPECEPYSDDDMANILRGMLSSHSIKVDDSTIAGLAVASGANPRDMESIVCHITCLAGLEQEITVESVCNLAQMALDGLRPVHERYLQFLWDNHFEAPPSAISSYLRINNKRLGLVENLLRLRGYINNGVGYRRELTPRGIERIGQTQEVWVPNW